MVRFISDLVTYMKYNYIICETVTGSYAQEWGT